MNQDGNILLPLKCPAELELNRAGQSKMSNEVLGPASGGIKCVMAQSGTLWCLLIKSQVKVNANTKYFNYQTQTKQSL